MDDKELFHKALVAVGGRKGVLALQCGVSRQTVSVWRKGELTEFARIQLARVASEEAGK